MAKNEQKEGKVKVRLLRDSGLGACNQVVEIDASEVAGLTGVVDADPAAVAYAESVAE